MSMENEGLSMRGPYEANPFFPTKHIRIAAARAEPTAMVKGMWKEPVISLTCPPKRFAMIAPVP
jgi:hypothetical protein